MAEVAVVVHRHAADVHANLAGFDGDEVLLGTGKGIVNFQHLINLNTIKP
jgi:hypothetical protein